MKIKAGNDERVWLFFRNIILIGGLLLILCPLWMVLINSFKTLEEAGKNFFALPSKLNLENYIELFTNSNYWIFLKNSFFFNNVIYLCRKTAFSDTRKSVGYCAKKLYKTGNI